jgi:hypothetical protein
MNANTTAQLEQTQKQEPIFSHRFDTTKAHDIREVVDAVGLMTDRAKGILYMMFAHSGGDTRYNEKIEQAAISAVIAEVDDIDSVLQAYWAANAERGAK